MIYKTILVLYYGHQCYQYAYIAKISYDIIYSVISVSGRICKGVYVILKPSKNENNTKEDECDGWIMLNKK